MDQDAAPSTSSVMKRSTVHPLTSNFFFADYKLILELSEDCLWSWHPSKTVHGTTLSIPVCAHPREWKTLVERPALLETGQVTAAFVITKAAISAASKPRIS